MLHTPYTGLPVAADKLVEILDQSGRPLLLARKETAEARNLPHRVALVLLRDRSGRLWLTRSSQHQADTPPYWDFSARGQILAGEARADAAARLLREAFALQDAQALQRAALPPLDFEGARQCLLFTAVQRGGQAPPQTEGLFVDTDELNGIAEHFPELLSPCLLWCVRNGYLSA